MIRGRRGRSGAYVLVRRRSAIVYQVGGEQCEREEDETEDEIKDEAVPLASSNTSGPERNGDPDDQKNDCRESPADR